jgi:CheY-like chemotaxis protein
MGAVAQPLEGMRVLLVEDAADIREIFGILLRMEGAGVVATASGREAATRLRREPFDVLLTDLGLPDLPGEMVIGLAALARPRPRIVVVTGYDEPHLSAAWKAGADAVLTKPTAWPVLLDRLTGREAPAAVAPSSSSRVA